MCEWRSMIVSVSFQGRLFLAPPLGTSAKRRWKQGDPGLRRREIAQLRAYRILDHVICEQMFGNLRDVHFLWKKLNDEKTTWKITTTRQKTKHHIHREKREDHLRVLLHDMHTIYTLYTSYTHTCIKKCGWRCAHCVEAPICVHRKWPTSGDEQMVRSLTEKSIERSANH